MKKKTRTTLSKPLGNLVAATLALVTAAALTGCAGYRLGSMLPPDIRTVYVPTFVNETDEPLLEVVTTRETLREIQLDGSLKIADADRADTVLTVKLKSMTLLPIDFDEDRRAQADEYRVVIEASLALTHALTGEVIAQSGSVSGREEFEVTGDLTTSKDAALPEAARDLAHSIVEAVVEAW